MTNQRSDTRQQLRDMTNGIKLDSGCVDCGYAQHPAALDFSRKDGHYTPDFNVSRLITNRASKKRILEEIAVCDVVCANCNRVRAAERRQERKAPQ